MRSIVRIYVRKSREKKFLEKNPGNKNFGKKVTGNKVLCFGFLGLFFPKIVWGAANKVSGKKSPEENKSEEKKL